MTFYMNSEQTIREVKIPNVKLITFDVNRDPGKYKCRKAWAIKYDVSITKFEIYSMNDDVCSFYQLMFFRYTLLTVKDKLLRNDFSLTAELSDNMEVLGQYGLDLTKYIATQNVLNKHEVLDILDSKEQEIFDIIPKRLPLDKRIFTHKKCSPYENTSAEGYSLCHNLQGENYLVVINNQTKGVEEFVTTRL
jgi:hypothetical protein